MEDPKYPPDPEALLDFNAGIVLDAVTAYEGRLLADIPTISIIEFPDDRHLSRNSRELSAPDDPAFKEFRLKPLIVPKP